MVDAFKKFRIWTARCIAPDFFEEQAKTYDDLKNSVDQRIASVIAKVDPFDLLIKDYYGIFSTEYEHPEERLDARGQLLMKTWGYQQRDDPSFKYMINWIMDQGANDLLKRTPIVPERIMYGRALLANMLLFRKEVGRLARLYEDELEKNKSQEFSSEITVEL